METQIGELTTLMKNLQAQNTSIQRTLDESLTALKELGIWRHQIDSKVQDIRQSVNDLRSKVDHLSSMEDTADPSKRAFNVEHISLTKSSAAAHHHAAAGGVEQSKADQMQNRPEDGAHGRDALIRVEISPPLYDLSEDSEEEDDHCMDDIIRYDLSVWVAEVERSTDDVAETPPPFIVYCRDLLEKGWGWQRLVPYCHGNVDWFIFKEYLKEYFIQNAGEVAALCANKKPEKDKEYFSRIAGGAKVKDKSIHSHNVSRFIQGVAAEMCIQSEFDFRIVHDDILTAGDIILSQKIEERADHVMIQSKGGYGYYANAAAALVCIIKESDLLYQLYDCNFDTTELVELSKKVRQCAYELLLYEGPECAAAAGAMLGLAKEAKFLCYVLRRENGFIYRDYYCCHDIRRQTAKALDMLLQETSSYGHVSWALVVAKSEKPQGNVGYLKYASDNGDVNVASAGAESEKPQGTAVDLKCASDKVDVNGASAGARSEKPEGTVGYLNCEVSDSME